MIEIDTLCNCEILLQQGILVLLLIEKVKYILSYFVTNFNSIWISTFLNLVKMTTKLSHMPPYFFGLPYYVHGLHKLNFSLSNEFFFLYARFQDRILITGLKSQKF
jgi:hypothetical protein